MLEAIFRDPRRGFAAHGAGDVTDRDAVLDPSCLGLGDESIPLLVSEDRLEAQRALHFVHLPPQLRCIESRHEVSRSVLYTLYKRLKVS